MQYYLSCTTMKEVGQVRPDSTIVEVWLLSCLDLHLRSSGQASSQCLWHLMGKCWEHAGCNCLCRHRHLGLWLSCCLWCGCSQCCGGGRGGSRHEAIVS